MKCALKSEIVVAHKDTQIFFSHDNQKTNCSSRMFTEWTTAKFTVGRDWPHHDRSRSDTVMNYINFNSYANLVMFFMIPAWFYFVFEHETIYAIRVLSMFDFYCRKKAHNLTGSENLRNSDCPFRFLFEDFRLCSRFLITSITAHGMLTKNSKHWQIAWQL